MENKPHLFDLIYAIIRQVPPGKVTTYGQVARIAGRCSAQMVGFALAALRSREELDDVPWQRVINSQGKISPHGLGMGSVIQRELLEEEGIKFDSSDVVDLQIYSWDGNIPFPTRRQQDII